MKHPQGFPALSRRCPIVSRDPADFPEPSPGLWEPTYSCSAQGTRDPLLSQASRATHATVGLVSSAEAFSQADAASVILAPALLPIISIGSSRRRSPTPS